MRLDVKAGQCFCGCGEDTAPKRDFRMGHDQRFRGTLIRAHLAGERVVVSGDGSEYTAMQLADRFGPSWRASLQEAEGRKRQAMAELMRTAERETREHKIGKNLKAGWEVCVITQLRNGGREIRYVDRQGKKGKVNVAKEAA